MKKICLVALVLLVGMSATVLADEPIGDTAPWFSDGADDGGLWTTDENWWRETAPTNTEDVGHDYAEATLTINSSLGPIYANSLYVGVWGPGPDGQAYFSMDSGLFVLAEELMIGYRDYDCSTSGQFWENWANGSATILDGIIAVGGGATPGIGTLGIGSTDFEEGVGGIGELHIDGGIIRAEVLSFGVVDPCIPGSETLENSVDITNGKLLLPGDISSLDSRVTAFGGTGSLVFTYEADQAGYTTVTAIPEPATVLLLGLGGLVLLRCKRARA